MKRRLSNQRTGGLTLVEVLVAIAAVALLAIILLPALAKSKARSSRISCISNLKGMGLAFRMFSGDHGEKFPWVVSITNGGTLEFSKTADVFRHFLAISNELSSPKVLHCNNDAQRSKASSWDQLTNNTPLSYFAGLDSNEALPETILTGDRNITGGLIASNGIMRFGSTSLAGWGQDMHHGVGNIGLADGSVLQVTDKSLRKQIQAALLSTNVAALRFSVPKPNQYP